MSPRIAQKTISRRAAAVAAVVAAAGLSFTVGVAWAADPRLDLADDALENAAALLEASQAGEVSDNAQRKFDRAVDRAITEIERSRAQIVVAQNAVDNP